MQALEPSELQVFAAADMVVVLEEFCVVVVEADWFVFVVVVVTIEAGFVVVCAAVDVGFAVVAVVANVELTVIAVVAVVLEEAAVEPRVMTSPLRSSDTAKNCDQ